MGEDLHILHLPLNLHTFHAYLKFAKKSDDLYVRMYVQLLLSMFLLYMFINLIYCYSSYFELNYLNFPYTYLYILLDMMTISRKR